MYLNRTLNKMLSKANRIFENCMKLTWCLTETKILAVSIYSFPFIFRALIAVQPYVLVFYCQRY
jgi:hypothetical protein